VGEPVRDGNNAERERVPYLGTAPGVGKTCAMHNDGRRRTKAASRSRSGGSNPTEPQTQLRNLVIVPSRWVDHRGYQFEEHNVTGAMGRRPDAVLIDELAHACRRGT
jgi:two-component system sensor histidine kinase KdpD